MLSLLSYGYYFAIAFYMHDFRLLGSIFLWLSSLFLAVEPNTTGGPIFASFSPGFSSLQISVSFLTKFSGKG